MTETNVASAPRTKMADALTKEETAMLWTIMNTQGAGTPFASAHIAAGLFAKVKEAAAAHGLVAA